MNWIRPDGRLAPYTHEPGVVFPLLGTSLAVQIFPSLLRLLRAEDGKWTIFSEIVLSIRGPLEDFTVQLDPFSGRLVVFGKSMDGWLHYFLQEGKIVLKKVPSGEILFIMNGKEARKQQGETLHLTDPTEETQVQFLEKLSLGGHKVQDLRTWKQKCDPIAVWPIWFVLGQQRKEVVSSENGCLGGMEYLLEEWHQAVQGGHPEKIVPAWRRFFLAAFSDCLIPRFVDGEHRGIVSDVVFPKRSPWELLRRGATVLRQLFVKEEKENLFFLPHLPPECHAGRMHLFLQGERSSIRCDLEWTKKRIRRLFFLSPETREVVLHCKDCARFRVRRRMGEKGYFLETGAKILLQGGQSVLLDRFEK